MLYAPTHLKQALWVLILAIMALAIACGSGEPATTAPSPTATTQPESPPEPTAPALSTEIPEVTEDASPAQPEITATPAGERGTPPERPQTRSEPTPGPQPETPAVEQPTAAPPPTAIPATAIQAAAPTYNPGPTSEYLYEETSAETDRTVLELFYERTEGEWWTNSENWMTEAPLGEWYGITTNAQGRVTEIRFGNNNLDGTLLPEIGNLSQLKVLYIRGNYRLATHIPTDNREPVPAGDIRPRWKCRRRTNTPGNRQSQQPAKDNSRRKPIKWRDTSRTRQPSEPGMARPQTQPAKN